MTPDRAAFVRRHTRVLAVPLVPEIRLHTADDATELWEKTEADLDRLNLPPPFWAFPWAGGQALARHVLDHPERVRGARVLDVASGAGLVAIAAALAGAAAVEANDIDPFALAAIALNAALNGAGVAAREGSLVGRNEGWDVVLAADIFYERDTAAAMTAWFRSLASQGVVVMLGDPGRAYFDPAGLDRLAEYQVPVSRTLEDAEIKPAGVWRVVP